MEGPGADRAARHAWRHLLKRFELIVDGVAQELETDGTAVVADGLETLTDISTVGPGEFSVILDGRQYAVHVTASNDGQLEAWVGGSRLLIEVRDRRRLSRRRNASAESGPNQVRMPMPGKVLAVHVADGDRVQLGQSLVIVEAMKMQNQLRAPRDGVVKGLRIKAGDAVPAGATLAVVE